jgi:hypothetical protein|tara:strand:+ start:4732 stop:4872 length:141 start_codon:yes stop_codon:yes gene_type:complete
MKIIKYTHQDDFNNWVKESKKKIKKGNNPNYKSAVKAKRLGYNINK